jgi:hypothetical protein
MVHRTGRAVIALVVALAALVIGAAPGRAAVAPALGQNASLSQLGQPTDPAIANIVLRIRKYSPTLGWYVNAADFAHALDQVGLEPGMSPQLAVEPSDALASPMTAATLTTPTTVTHAQGATLWGNVNSSGGAPPNYGIQPQGQRVGWRYNYNSSYANVLQYQDSIWGFMLRSEIGCCHDDGSPN